MKDKKLNIYIYNTLCSSNVFDELFHKYNAKSGNATQNFFKLLAEGFALNPNTSVTVNSLLPVNSKDQKNIFWKYKPDKENNINYRYIPLINIPVLRNILLNIFVFFRILFTRFPVDANNVILVDFLRFSVNLSVVLASKIKGINVVTIVTDLPGLDVLKHSVLTKIRNKFIFLLKYDFYISVTEDLNKFLNINKKPFLIIESFANIEFSFLDNSLTSKYAERVLVYAGGLYERYGMKTLIEAFKLLPEKDLRLWFYGAGPFARDIIEYSKNDDRIQYKGIVPNSELVEVLIRATLLINPRPTHEDFTKYSFPSKNLEYMSSGTPLLTTKLAGIPLDHCPYVFFIENDSVDGINKGISNVLKLNRSEIHSFGLVAKEYTLREKNNVTQSEKIINLLIDNI
jgi:glycosyltransferase involved in cell wall biosynthesis